MKRALLFVTLLVATLLTIPVAAANAATCEIQFSATYPPGWTQVSNTPTAWSTTDGNVIAQDVAYTAGGPYLVIGGNFTLIHNKATGRDVPARNLAVLRIRDGHVMWGASAMTGYVKNITVHTATNTIYVGGGFTSINGVARKAVAAFSATSYALRPWAPVVNGGTIRSIQASDAGVVYLAGNGGVGAYRADNAAKLWYTPAAGGVVHALLLSPDQSGLYAGGIFTALGGVPQGRLALIKPLSTGAVQASFAPDMSGSYAGEYVLKLRWDLAVPTQPRLVVAAGGATPDQSIQEVDPYFGGKYWSFHVEGDTQAIAVVGNTILSGHHRSHGNGDFGCPFAFFGNQWARDGFVLPWDPGLSGNPTQASYLSEANGGIADILYEPQTRQVFVVGDFSRWGAACDYDTLACTGGNPQRGVAVYRVP
jgi:hypothetical protein